MPGEHDQEKRVYETIIGATPDLVYVFDLQYRFTYANHALLTMWGKTWDTAVGVGLRENGYEEWHALMHEREIDQVAATGKSVRGEVSFPHAVLGRRVYDYILVPVFDENGKVEAVAGTTRDISDMKVAEKQLLESQERLRNLVIQAPTPIAIFRGDDLIAELANDQYLAVIDKTAEEFINTPLFESLPRLRPLIEPLINEVITTGKLVKRSEFEVTLRRNDRDEKVFFNFTYSPLLLPNGKVEGFMVVANDVTEQVLARRKVEDSEAALKNAIDLAELSNWTLDMRTGEMTLSDRYAQTYGTATTYKDLDTALFLVKEEDRARVIEKLTQAMQPGAARFDAEYTITNPRTKSDHIVHSMGQAFFDEHGTLLYLEGTTQDVTAQRSLQLALENQVQVRTEELQATNEELATTNEELFESSNRLIRSNEELTQFAYVASHDLQEPVRKISVFVEMLEKSLPQIDERSKRYLTKIDESANRMLTLIRDVLSHSQISNLGSSFTSVDLNKVLSEVLVAFEVVLQDTRSEVTSDELPVIEAIDVQMSQLFGNLISNAIKYSVKERLLRLKISAKQLTDEDKSRYPTLFTKKNYFKISFADNGIGFDQSHAAQIFEIFQRLHSRNEYSGTGIGLATCKKIVENHRGLITATSVPGAGSTFEVILPNVQN